MEDRRGWKDDKEGEAQDEMEEDISESTTKQTCVVHDKCRVCSFKELQMMPECQETGFRLIKRCTELEATRQSLISDSYLNEACPMYNGTIA